MADFRFSVGRGQVPMAQAASWLENRFQQIVVATNQAFWDTLRGTLPSDARITGVTIDRDGVRVQEISHGLTSEGMNKAITAMYNTRNALWADMIQEFQQKFLGAQ